MNVLLLILDGLSPRHVRPDVMPALTALGEAGGWNREGGLGVMPASTYPNHATFVTGAPPGLHGLWSSKIPSPAFTPEPGAAAPLVEVWDVGPRTPTLFDACRRAGRSTAAVFGDHHLVGAMGAGAADLSWPEGGAFGPEIARDALEYADDAVTAEQIAQAIGRSPDLVVAQLNGPDTSAHLYGPDSDEAFEAYRWNDAAIARVRLALEPRWEDWVVMVVSDHSQEDGQGESIDLDAAAHRAGVETRVIRDGSAAIITGEGGRDPRWLDDVGAVVGTEPLADDTVVAWGRPGSSFGEFPWGIPGIHGSPRTLPQVAVVSGGHGAVDALAEWVEESPPPGTAWAGKIARLLDLPADSGIPA
ncbi:MAG TPA: alkaline phosphatase family protein [Acidimicrobiales bacterium]|nr:alkaline phosphatase family protein [Acidimicrobiales bacterium]